MRTYPGLGNGLWEGTDKPCAPGPRRKEPGPHERPTQTRPGVSRSLRGRHGSVAACCRVGALSGAVCARDLWKEVTIIFIICTIVWPQVNNGLGGTQPCPSTENWIKVLLSTAPPIKTRPVSSTVSLSHQETFISLLSFSLRGQTE